MFVVFVSGGMGKETKNEDSKLMKMAIVTNTVIFVTSMTSSRFWGSRTIQKNDGFSSIRLSKVSKMKLLSNYTIHKKTIVANRVCHRYERNILWWPVTYPKIDLIFEILVEDLFRFENSQSYDGIETRLWPTNVISVNGTTEGLQVWVTSWLPHWEGRCG